MVLPTFVKQALTGNPITVFGDGTQSRSFTYVGDVVNALMQLAQDPGAVGEVFNIGNVGEVSMLDLAQKVKAMTGSSSQITMVPYEQAYEAGFEDMPRRVPDLSKLRDLIGYQPTMNLDQIVASVISHMRATLSGDTDADADTLVASLSRRGQRGPADRLVH
jgi:UDP-glucose 4-epimerase